MKENIQVTRYHGNEIAQWDLEAAYDQGIISYAELTQMKAFWLAGQVKENGQ